MVELKDINCIIPFKLSTQDRFDNLVTVLSYFKKFFPDIVVTIVEQDVVNKVRFNNVIFIPSKEPFNKSLILNRATKLSTKDFILYWDADMIVQPEYLQQAVNKFDEVDVIKPYNYLSVYDVPISNSSMFRKTLDFKWFEKVRPRPGCPFGGGIFGIRREKMIEIGGFFEEFLGWGCEDEAVSIKLKKMTQYYQTGNSGYHLYHSRTIFDKAYHSLYQKNVEILNRYLEMSDSDFITVCDIQRKKFMEEK